MVDIVVDLLLFFFNDTATTEIYTLSLHDALPIFHEWYWSFQCFLAPWCRECERRDILCFHSLCNHKHKAKQYEFSEDRKSTRLNSSHANISYAVFCLKQKDSNTTSRPDTTSIT